MYIITTQRLLFFALPGVFTWVGLLRGGSGRPSHIASSVHYARDETVAGKGGPSIVRSARVRYGMYVMPL